MLKRAVELSAEKILLGIYHVRCSWRSKLPTVMRSSSLLRLYSLSNEQP